MQLRKLTTLLSITLLLVASSVASAASFKKQTNPPAQNKPATSDSITGKYDGVAKSDQLGDIPITVEIKSDGGKLSGKIDTPQGAFPITSGTFADGKVMIKFDAGGNEGLVNATLNGDKITGKWEISGQGGPLELKRMGATTATAGTEKKKEDMKPPTTAGDPISGEWDANAEAQGNSFPFTLKLKLDGEKVSGSSDSAQGSVPISKGSYAANKLSVTLDLPQGPVVLTGMVKDGKVVGEFDFAGQMTGKWEAKKK